MIRSTRRAALGALLAFALAGCGGASDSNSSATAKTETNSQTVALQDIVFGDADAPVTLVEYASWTCPGCLDFHSRIMPSVRSDYIETGKVRLVFREFPTPPVDVAVAGFALARCAGEADYYDVLDELFMRQDAILTLARQGGPVVEALKQVAANHGIVGDDAFQACLDDQSNRDAIRASIAAARAKDVSATPTLFLDGVLMDNNARLSPETFAAALDDALAKSSVPTEP